MPRLVIRVNNAQEAAPEELKPKREIVEYRWDRIIAATVVLVLLLAAIGWLLTHWLSLPREATPVVREEAPVFREDGAGRTAVELPSVNDQAASEAQQSTPFASEERLPTPPAVPQSPPAQTTAERPERTKETPSASPAARSEAETPVATETTPQEPAAPPTSPTQAPTGPAAEPVVAESREPAPVETKGSSFRRAQLTTNVVNGEPVDQLPAVVPMNEQGLLRIYLFTETAGLQDRTVYHYWMLDGKQMARVRVPTSRKPIVASSSKFIDRHMLGNWTVKVIDDRNRLWVTANFKVVE